MSDEPDVVADVAPAFSHADLQRHLAAVTLSREGAAEVDFVKASEFTQAQFSEMLARLRSGEPAIVHAADGLMESLGFAAENPIRKAAVQLALRASNDTVENAAYHNHQHDLDVVCSFWRLGTARSEHLSREDLTLGVLAAIGHDLGYDPTSAGPVGHREERSISLSLEYLNDVLAPEARDRFVAMIRGTEASKYDSVRTSYLSLDDPTKDSDEQRTSRMTALLVRADLTASTATTEALNRTMSRNLAREVGVDKIAELDDRHAFVSTHGPFTLAEEEKGYTLAHEDLVNRLSQELELQRREGPEILDLLPQWGNDEQPVRVAEVQRQPNRNITVS